MYLGMAAAMTQAPVPTAMVNRDTNDTVIPNLFYLEIKNRPVPLIFTTVYFLLNIRMPDAYINQHDPTRV